MNKFEELLNKFDFEKVRAYMVLTNWVWFDPYTNKSSVPTIERMKEVCSNLYYFASQPGTVNSSTGGFRVTVKDNKTTIEFIIDSSSVYD